MANNDKNIGKLTETEIEKSDIGPLLDKHNALSNNATGKPALPVINPFNRYIENGEAFGLTVPVRVHDLVSPEKAREIITASYFAASMARAKQNRQALAIPATLKPTLIPFPTNILGTSAGAGSGGLQSFDMGMLAEQIAAIVKMYGSDMGAVKKPLKNSHVGTPQHENGNAVIRVTLANGKQVSISITVEK